MATQFQLFCWRKRPCWRSRKALEVLPRKRGRLRHQPDSFGSYAGGLPPNKYNCGSSLILLWGLPGSAFFRFFVLAIFG